MDAGTQSAPENQSEIQTTGSGPVYISAHTPTTLFLQLEAGPSSRSHGCLSAGLDDGERLCQSTVVSNRTCSQQNPSTRSSSLGGSSLERLRLVSGFSRDVEGLSTTYSSTGILLQREGTQKVTEITPQLAVWPVSGKDTEAASF